MKMAYAEQSFEQKKCFESFVSSAMPQNPLLKLVQILCMVWWKLKSYRTNYILPMNISRISNLGKNKKTQIMKNAFIVSENKIDARLFLFLFLFNTFLFNIYVANIYASSLKSTMQFSVACLSPIIVNNKNKINIKFVNRKTIILIHSLILIRS